MKISPIKKLLLSTLSVLMISNAWSADHLDGIDVQKDPSTDITDVFAWSQGDKLNLILNVFPFAGAESKFSDSAYYVFNISSQEGYGVAGMKKKLICYFEADQKISCAMDDKMMVMKKDASSEEGASSESGKFKVFAGLRDDPFFFDLNNFNTVREIVRDAAPSLTFDEASCPQLDEQTQSNLVTILTGQDDGTLGGRPGQDTLDGANVLSIAVQIDKDLVGAGPIYGVSGSTHKKQ